MKRARQLALEDVPVIVLDHLTPAQLLALNGSRSAALQVPLGTPRKSRSQPIIQLRKPNIEKVKKEHEESNKS